MKALLLSEYGRLEMAELPMPRPSADEVLVRVKACGICGSDVHGYDGSSGRRIPPLVMGHEASGVIVAVGSDVKIDLPVGAKVAVDPSLYCGYCRRCRSGRDNLCENWAAIGDTVSGAFAEYVAVPAVNAHLLRRLLRAEIRGGPYEGAPSPDLAIRSGDGAPSYGPPRKRRHG